MFSLVQRGTEWRSCCRCWEPSAEVLKDLLQHGGSQERACGGKNAILNISFWIFLFWGRGMSDKGVGEAAQREFHVHFPLLWWVQRNPHTLYLQTPTISHKKIKEDFLGRVPKIPVDQPLEGNITQIHQNSTKAHPKCG